MQEIWGTYVWLESRSRIRYIAPQGLSGMSSGLFLYELYSLTQFRGAFVDVIINPSPYVTVFTPLIHYLQLLKVNSRLQNTITKSTYQLNCSSLSWTTIFLATKFQEAASVVIPPWCKIWYRHDDLLDVYTQHERLLVTARGTCACRQRRSPTPPARNGAHAP